MTMKRFSVDELKFDDKGLIPAVVREADSGDVLMMAYMNRESLQKTLETGRTWFFSRSRQKLWMKGETSGHVQTVQDIKTDCDQDTLLIDVVQEGAGACHEGFESCFHYGVAGGDETQTYAPSPEQTFDPASVYGTKAAVLNELYEVILERKAHPERDSYTCYLFREGINKILKKVGEENAEVIIAAKDAEDPPVVYEVADLFYHVLVLLAERDITPDQIFTELQSRRK